MNKKMFISGEWVESDNQRRFEDFNPFDNSVYAQIPDAGRKDAEKAIRAADAAAAEWAEMRFHKRAELLNKAADLLAERQKDLAEILVSEGGAWIGKAMYESGYAPEIIRGAAASLYNDVGQVMPSMYGKVSMAIRKPLGVVSIISPWNFPVLLAMRAISFALAAGNTIVLKPSEETPVSGGLFLAEIFEAAGFPKGVVNVVTCSRESVAEVGDELVSNPLVKAISYTGSTAVGRLIASQAGQLLKKCCVELGGKDALVVLDDADLERAVDAAAFGTFMHQGQICMSVERIIVHEGIAEQFISAFVEKTKSLKVGREADCVIGPIINSRQIEGISKQVDSSIAMGATAETGAVMEGLFYWPTVLTNVTTEMPVWRDETFGPVAAVIVAENDEEVIRLANDSNYGLSCGVISNDEKRALSIVERIDTGMAHINCSSVNDEPHIPFGGSKDSGVGRHGGKWSIETFSETRWVTLDRGGRPFPF